MIEAASLPRAAFVASSGGGSAPNSGVGRRGKWFRIRGKRWGGPVLRFAGFGVCGWAVVRSSRLGLGLGVRGRAERDRPIGMLGELVRDVLDD
jgi:hypothetical protein